MGCHHPARYPIRSRTDERRSSNCVPKLLSAARKLWYTGAYPIAVKATAIRGKCGSVAPFSRLGLARQRLRLDSRRYQLPVHHLTELSALNFICADRDFTLLWPFYVECRDRWLA